MRLILCSVGIAAHKTTRFHRLDFGIPIEQHMVFLEVVVLSITRGVGWHDGRHRRELAKRVAKLGAYPVDRLLELYRLEFSAYRGSL